MNQTKVMQNQHILTRQTIISELKTKLISFKIPWILTKCSKFLTNAKKMTKRLKCQTKITKILWKLITLHKDFINFNLIRKRSPINWTRMNIFMILQEKFHYIENKKFYMNEEYPNYPINLIYQSILLKIHQ